MPDYYDLTTPVALCDHGRCGERVALRTCLRDDETNPEAVLAECSNVAAPQGPALARD
jgi:hypothetical protein